MPTVMSPVFFWAAAHLRLEEIVSKRASSPYRLGSRGTGSKAEKMVKSEFVLLGTEIDDSGNPGRNWLRNGRGLESLASSARGGWGPSGE
jgi:hypothetical protein